MVKGKAKQIVTQESSSASITSLSDNWQEFDLWYRIEVLLYDLSNLAANPLSANHTSSTTHELYIGELYFTEPEAARLWFALVAGSDDNATS